MELVKLVETTNSNVKKYCGKLFYLTKQGNYCILQDIDNESHKILTSNITNVNFLEKNIVEVQTLNSIYTLEKVGDVDE